MVFAREGLLGYRVDLSLGWRCHQRQGYNKTPPPPNTCREERRCKWRLGRTVVGPSGVQPQPSLAHCSAETLTCELRAHSESTVHTETPADPLFPDRAGFPHSEDGAGKGLRTEGRPEGGGEALTLLSS